MLTTFRLLVREKYICVLQVTWVPQRQHHGMLDNQAFAIRYVCMRDDQVIVTLDADDCLLGCNALRLVHKAHFVVKFFPTVLVCTS